MRKKLLCLFAIIVIEESLFSQSTFMTNNYSGGADFLGYNLSNGSNPLQIRTNNLNRIIVSQLLQGSALVPGGNNNNVPGFGLTRIGINYDGGAGAVSPITFPRSILHMGQQQTGNGIRDWMDLGTLISKGSDLAFFGLRQKSITNPSGRISQPGDPTGNDNNDAVITFGDNGLGPVGAGSDNLTFIYAAQNTNQNVNGPFFANSAYGREMMRMTGNGNIGVGPVFFDNEQPQNMLHLNAFTTNEAYLQFTSRVGTQQTINDGFHIGITNNVFGPAGVAEIIQKENLDLRFYTNNNQEVVIKNNGLVGFNTNTPGNEVEITSRATTPYGLTGSGLKFSNMTSSNATMPNPGLGVLSVDNVGNVIYVQGGAQTANQGLTVAGNNVQLGNLCANPAIMTGNRAINMSGGNFAWLNGNSGFGTTCGPLGNRVVIQGLGANQSGLRFNNLTSATPTIVNAAQGVLSVNGQGDVVLVEENQIAANNGIVVNPTSGIIQLGSNCANTNASGKSAQGLQNTRYLHLNGNNFIFGDGGRVGIGMAPFPPGNACAVGNKLEVISTTGVPYFGSANGSSGLRLTNLTSAVTPLPNGTNGLNATKVLSVDGNGDVVLTNAIGLQGPIGLTGPAGPTGPAGGGIVNAQNGLNLLNPTTVELGGGLLQNTQISQQVKDMEFELVNGNFMVGGANGYGLGIGQNNILFGSQNTVLGNGNKIMGDLNNLTANSILVEGSSNTVNSPNAIGTSIFGNFNNSLGDQNNFLIGSANNTPSGNLNNMLLGFANQSSNGYLAGQYGMAVGMGVPTFLNTLIIGNSTNHGLNAAALDVLNNGFNINALATKRSFPALIIDGSNFIGVRKQNVNYGSIEVNAIEYGAGNSCGIWASADNTAPANTSIAARFDGDVVFNGTLLGTNNIVTSDQQFKTNVDTITNPVAIIKNLLPKTYYLDTTNIYNMNFSSKKQYGFIAQDVQTVLPELVSTVVKPTIMNPNTNTIIEQGVTYKSLNYNAFFALITAAMQKQQRQIEKQDSIITLQANLLSALTQSINACCSNSGIRTTGIIGNQTNVELSDKNVIVLNQNVPNPFAESTIITYNIPVDFKVAQIIFNAMDGRIIKAVDINQKGKGQINVYANDLTNGLYSYYLVVDGKVIDTKKLIKQN